MWAIAGELDGNSGGRALMVVVDVNVVALRRKETIYSKSCQFWNMNKSHVSLGWAF
jgi:hypothetical protein